MHLITKPSIESAPNLTRTFLPHQIQWINAEDKIHACGRQAIALAEKSVRIGWTYADAFKNVRKRLLFPKRDYLFATKDYPSALEYMQQCYRFAEIFNLTRCIKNHGEETLTLNRLDELGRASAFTEDVKVGVIKFDNGSRIIAFSANPQAMAVYGGDVGLDEFAKHPNARLLWETAQGRVTWGYDLAIWSSHDGEDTLFNEFAQEARAACGQCRIQNSEFRIMEGHDRVASSASLSSFGGESRREEANLSLNARRSVIVTDSTIAPPLPSPLLRSAEERGKSVISIARSSSGNESSSPALDSRPSTIDSPKVPWNLYFKVTIQDAIANGLVETINKSRGTKFTAQQFLADCKARARDEEIFQQAYMCNPLGASTNHIVEWSAIERCRYDYETDIERVHLEADEIQRKFGTFDPDRAQQRVEKIVKFLEESFPKLDTTNGDWRLGFDVAASGQGDLAVIYIDEVQGNIHWLRALFTCRTEDWHFLKTVLFSFMASGHGVRGAGDETGLGRQICWEARQAFGDYRWRSVNFASSKHDLGFNLMNQLSVAEKRFPRSAHDIASDYFALRKMFNGTKWAFSEGKNALNPASRCDIAWAGALASEAPTGDGPSAHVA